MIFLRLDELLFELTFPNIIIRTEALKRIRPRNAESFLQCPVSALPTVNDLYIITLSTCHKYYDNSVFYRNKFVSFDTMDYETDGERLPTGELNTIQKHTNCPG